MIKYSLVVASVALAVLICAATPGCRRDGPETHNHVESRTILRDVCIYVRLAESTTQEQPPTKVPELIGWLEAAGHVSKDEAYINYHEKTITDAWGNKVVVVSQAGKFVGVGSPGPDGIWQEGTGDDILVTLESVK